MIKSIINFSITLFVFCIIIFGLHLFILNQLNLALFDNLIIQAYVFNFFFAVIVFFVITWLSQKNPSIVGFVFMGTSLIKFAVFFIFFAPTYRMDDKMSKIEFLTFFVPYAICLTYETKKLIKTLNQ